MSNKRIRLSLARNSGRRRGQIQCGICVKADFQSILKAAVNKLRLSKKERKKVKVHPLGPSMHRNRQHDRRPSSHPLGASPAFLSLPQRPGCSSEARRTT